MAQPDKPSADVAIVLSGAAARGGFQAGALATLMPALEHAGIRPRILLGTSAGAINASLWAAKAHLSADEAAEELCNVWRRMSHANVFAPLIPGSLVTGIEFLTGAVLNRGGGTTSLLDTGPLRDTAAELLDTDRIAENIAAGRPAKLGVIATRVPPAAADSPAGTASGRSVLFLHEQQVSDYAGNPERAQDVARAPIQAEHVLASAAIPMAFPAQRITEPPDATGWYVDGGVRLNTPVRPAIALGARRIIVISATSTEYGQALPPDPGLEPPDLTDTGAQALHAVLADRMVEDLLAVRRTNRLIEQLANASPASRLRRSDDTPYEKIELLTVSPPAGEMGRLAAEIFERRTSGVGALRERDNWLIGRMLRGAGDASGRRELLSYLLFDEDYFAESIELGREQAARHLPLADEWST